MTNNLLKGKVAIVTGASSGVGRETAKLFAKEGAKVIAAARREEKLKELVEEIRKDGGEADYSITDISDEESVKAMVQKAVDTFGRLDIAINNAAPNPDEKPIYELEEKDLDLRINIVLKGAAYCMKHQTKQMMEQGEGGSIINVSAGAVRREMANLPAYIATKAAIEAMTKTTANEVGKYGIRVNCTRLGTIETPMLVAALEALGMTPEEFAEEKTYLGRLGTPNDIAKALLILSTEYASYITGAIIDVDGGLRL